MQSTLKAFEDKALYIYIHHVKELDIVFITECYTRAKTFLSYSTKLSQTASIWHIEHPHPCWRTASVPAATSASRSFNLSCFPVTSTAETRTEKRAPVRSFCSLISLNSQAMAHGMTPRFCGESSTPIIVYVLPGNIQHIHYTRGPST